MRLVISIGDKEYRDALVSVLSDYDRDIFVEIADAIRTEDIDEAVVLTDIDPHELEVDDAEKVRKRAVFLTVSKEEGREDCQSRDSGIDEGMRDFVDTVSVFKYSNLPEIMESISLVYGKVSGNFGIRNAFSRTIAVCNSCDSYNHEVCKILARQILYNYGGQILILPLSYINDYAIKSNHRREVLRRLMYQIGSDRGFAVDAYTYSDSYGIYYLNLGEALNPIASLELCNLKALIRAIGSSFDTIILDVGNSFRNENIEIMKEADNILFFSDSRLRSIDEVIGTDEFGKVYHIRYDGIIDEVIAIDEYIRTIYEKRGKERSDQRYNN